MDRINSLIADLNEPLSMRHSVDILAWIDDEKAIDATINAILYEDHQMRESAFNGLTRGGTLVVSRLIIALQNESPLIREFVLEVLGKIKEPAANNAIIHMLSAETNHLVRQEAIKTLGQIANPDSVVHLTPFLHYENKFTRWRTVEALGKINNDNARNAIAICLYDSDENVRNAVRHLIYGNVSDK